MSLDTAIVVTALTLCFPPAPSESSVDERCGRAVSDVQLAAAVTGWSRTRSAGSVLTIAESEGRDQMRLTASAASVASDLWWSEKELEALTEAAHPFTPPGPDATPSLFGDPMIVSGPGGSASITMDIRMGEIRVGGDPI